MKNQLAVKGRKMLASSLSPELGTAYAELRQQLRGFLRRHVKRCERRRRLIAGYLCQSFADASLRKSIANVSAWLYIPPHAPRLSITIERTKMFMIELDESHWVSEEDELELHSKLALCRVLSQNNWHRSIATVC